MARCCIVLALLLAVGGATLIGKGGSTARAACGSDAGDTIPYTVIAPPVSDFQASGEAPLQAIVRIDDGVVVVPVSGEVSVTASFDWGDGTPQLPVTTVSCGDDTAYWPAQTFTHTFTVPRPQQPYRVAINVVLSGTSVPTQSFPLPVMFVTVTGAATPVPTSIPTVAPTATVGAPIGTATAVGTPSPGAQNTPAGGPSPGTSPQPGAGLASATVTSSSPAAPTRPSTSPAGATPSPAPSATSMAHAAAPPPPAGPIEVVASLRAPAEVSTDPEVAATNLVLAGVTVWVLFSSVMLNQVLQGNRDEIDRRTARLTGPLRRACRSLASMVRQGGSGSLAGTISLAGLVLAATALIYTVLEPGVGWNRSTLTLLVSAFAGIGLVTYVSSGLEAAMTRRVGGVAAAVRPFPAAIAIALVSVVVSRALDFRPGVMYGFVASCAVLAPVAPDARKTGRIAASPTVATLVLALGAWLLVGPLRSWRESSGAWPAEALEAISVVVFVGGIEAMFISMIPLAVTDGGKIFRWSRLLWLGFAVASAFLVWHVLLGRERTYFSGLRQASSLTVLLVFVVYTVLTLGLWTFFRFRRSPARPD